MSLTTPQLKQATKWFVRQAFKIPGVPATIDVFVAFTAAQDTDGWFDSSPAGDTAQTYGHSVKAAMDASFTDEVSATGIALMVASVAAVRSGAV
jgi:hypothetical protein